MNSRKLGLFLVAVALIIFGFSVLPRRLALGRQPDGKYLVSSGQLIGPGTVEFEGRPSDFALHPKNTGQLARS